MICKVTNYCCPVRLESQKNIHLQTDFCRKVQNIISDNPHTNEKYGKDTEIIK